MKKLLFVPGYFGSTLIDRKSKENRWVRVSDFFSNKFDLRMHESYSDLETVNDVIDDQILMTVKLIPKVLEIESYDKTLRHLDKFCKETERELHTVTYDWRQDFHHSLKKISAKIEELTADGSKIDIVAHSNGGLLMAYYLRYGDQDFLEAKENWYGTSKIDHLSLVASPLKGAYSLFRHVKFGTPVLRNKKMMSSLDYTSFTSSYFFLPIDKMQNCFIGDKLEDRQLELFNITNWKRNGWGPYADSHQKEIPVNDKKFQLILERAQKFNQLLNQELQVTPPEKIKLQVVRAFGKKTFFYPSFTTENDLNYTYPKKHKIEGDGVVAHLASGPFPWMASHDLMDIDLKAEHLKVISEYKFQQYIHHFLQS